MQKLIDKLTNEWQDAANLLLGLWLMVSPWVLGYSGAQLPMGTAIFTGAVIALAAAGALYAFQPWEEWTNVALSAWLIVSPWVLGYANLESATLNHVITAALVGVLALWSTTIEHGSSGHMARK